MKILQIVGGNTPSWYENGNGNPNSTLDGSQIESDWVDLDADLYYWTKALRPVQVWIRGGLSQLNIQGGFGLDSNNWDWCFLVQYAYWVLATGQWYPGHIAKTEKELKEQLKLMDVVIEIRDARIPMSTSHPQVRVL